MTSPASRKRQVTDHDAGTTPSCDFITSQVLPQISVMMAKLIAVRKGERGGGAGACMRRGLEADAPTRKRFLPATGGDPPAP